MLLTMFYRTCTSRYTYHKKTGTDLRKGRPPFKIPSGLPETQDQLLVSPLLAGTLSPARLTVRLPATILCIARLRGFVCWARLSGARCRNQQDYFPSPGYRKGPRRALPLHSKPRG
jgi:hypothetical protein